MGVFERARRLVFASLSLSLSYSILRSVPAKSRRGVNAERALRSRTNRIPLPGVFVIGYPASRYRVFLLSLGMTRKVRAGTRREDLRLFPHRSRPFNLDLLSVM